VREWSEIPEGGADGEYNIRGGAGASRAAEIPGGGAGREYTGGGAGASRAAGELAGAEERWRRQEAESEAEMPLYSLFDE